MLAVYIFFEVAILKLSALKMFPLTAKSSFFVCNDGICLSFEIVFVIENNNMQNANMIVSSVNNILFRLDCIFVSILVFFTFFGIV